MQMRREGSFPRGGRAGLVHIAGTIAACACVFLCVSAASAAAEAPVWNITSYSTPTYFPPNSTGEERQISKQGEVGGNEVVVTVRDLGGEPISGKTIPIRIAANLDRATFGGPVNGELSGWQCALGPFIGTCGIPTSGCATGTSSPCVLTYTGTMEPGDVIHLHFQVATGPVGDAMSAATVSGGEVEGTPVAPASVNQDIVVSTSHAPFGIQPTSVVDELVGENGAPETQADAHPYDFALDFALNNFVGHPNFSEMMPIEDMKDIAVELPAGVGGNELAVAQCDSLTLTEASCSGSSQVGTLEITISGTSGAKGLAIFNMKPSNGRTNELGFAYGGLGVHMPTMVRTGNDYGITNTTPNVPGALAAIDGVESNIWGVPADPRHNLERVLSGWSNENGGNEGGENGGHPSALAPAGFFTMPSQCGKPLVFRVAIDSYGHPGAKLPDGEPDLSDPNWKVASVTAPPLAGCEALQSFEPNVKVVPATTFADTPAGTTVELSVPQGEALTNPNELATPTVQDTSVTLPQGMVINPGQANGLGACQFSQDGVGTVGQPSCPADSKVGTVEIETPLLPDRLVGSVYVLQSNPSDLQLLIAASGDGVNLKLVGHVHLNEQTGQLTSTFDGTPALPFTHLRLTFSGGAQAALMTPPTCGVYSTTSDFTPWSSPFTQDALANDAFAIGAGPNGAPCASPLPFKPQMIAGASTDQAGGFTSFSMLLSRGDGEQRIAALQFNTPEGLLGMLSGVPLCQEPQAAQGTCSAASQIGHTIVGAGAGPAPLYIPEPGHAAAPIYLTGPYKGAPFGLAIVVPVIAGPFNLGTIVVRASIGIDPVTSQLTVSTEPLPQMLDGIPTDLRQINAVIDRPEFMFNPTSCAPMEFGGTAQSAQGTMAALSSHFQVGGCRSLTFKPNFHVETSAKTSRSDGASLTAKILYPAGKLGANQASSQSNVAYVKVELPRQLPSRLTTLQKACTQAVFRANPAECPAASRVGEASAVTPVLPVRLRGPAYFVSNGAAKFPELIIVLQGYGVTVDLHGETFINKAGVTSSTFASVPDVPIYAFELTLPEGPNSALAANGNLCASKLTMPTIFVGHNGAQLHQNTPVTVSGCQPQIHVIRHTVRSRKAMLLVSVPGAGRLTAGGAGTSRASVGVRRAGHVSVDLTLTRPEQGFLASHRGRRLAIAVRLRFTPRHGRPIASMVRLLMG